MRTADRSARLLAIIAAVLAAFLLGTPAFAQAVLQAGPPFGGHAAMYAPGPTIGSPAVLQDSGPAGSFNLGQGLSETLQVSRLPGTGPFGSHNCLYDQPSLTGANGAHFLCLDANSLGGGLLSYGAIGNATPLPFNCDINNVLTPCLGNASLPVFDPRSYGAVCGGADATAAIQAAVNAATLGGGWVSIVCPLKIAGTVTIANSIRLAGISANYPGQQDIPGPSGYPTTGSALQCTNVSGPCILVTGIGNEIDHINFWNPQPAVPSTCPVSGPCNNWTPTVYPFVIATQQNSGWQGLNIHNVTCTSCSNFVDLEGTPDYHLYTGTQITMHDLWCNACLNTGIKIHLIDNPLYISHVEFTPQWNFNLAPLGYYLRQNLIGFDIAYSAAPQFDNIDFFSTKSSIQLANASVVNNFGTNTFAISAAQFTNMMFNQVCQAITMPNGNGTLTPGQVAMTNVFMWGDQSGFNCSAGKALVQAQSNLVNLSFSQIGVWDADTFAAVGCGTPGVGSCPAQTATGSASLRINDMDVFSYSAFTAAQPFIKVPAGAYVSIGNTNPAAIRPAAGGGNIMAPGLDGTQGYFAPFFIGGGTNAIEGSAALQGGTNTGGTGFAAFFAQNGTELGYVGGCTTGGSAGCSFSSVGGNIYLKPNSGTTGAPHMTVGSSGTNLSLNVNPLPTTPPSGVGVGYLCFDNAGNVYAKVTCP